MLVVVAASGSGRGQQTLGQNHACAQARTVRSMTAFTNPVEAVAGGNHPGIGRGTLQVFAKVFEHRWGLRSDGSKVVKCFIHAGGKTGGRDIVSQNSAIHDLGEEGSLRD